MKSWSHWKWWLGDQTGLTDSALHAVGGVVVLFLAAAVLRRAPWRWGPWLALLALEVGNETYDMMSPLSGENWLGASLHDFWITMLAPTLLAVAMHWLRNDQSEPDSESCTDVQTPSLCSCTIDGGGRGFDGSSGTS